MQHYTRKAKHRTITLTSWRFLMPTAPNYLASNISFLAAGDGLSLIDLASETGVDPSTVYRLADTNNSRQPRARTLRGIADFFHVDPFALLEQDLRTTTYATTKEKPKPDALGDFSPFEKNERIPLIKITNPNAVDPRAYCLLLRRFRASRKHRRIRHRKMDLQALWH